VWTHHATSQSSPASWPLGSGLTGTFQGQLFHRRLSSAGSYAPRTTSFLIKEVRYWLSKSRSLIPQPRLRDAQDTVHRPATANVRPRTAEMLHDLSCRSSLLQSIREDSQPHGIQLAARHDPLVVGRLGEFLYGGREQGRIKRERLEGIAEDVTEKS